MNNSYTRREMLRLTGQAAIVAGMLPRVCLGEKTPAMSSVSLSRETPRPAQVGNKILAEGATPLTRQWRRR